MIAFEIAIDGQPVCTAGVGDLGVMSVIATWVRRASRDSGSGEVIPDRFEEELTLDVGGLGRETDGSSVSLEWIDQHLAVGQRVTFTVVDVPQVDPPKSRRREDPKLAEGSKREYYERLKREYGDA